MGERLLLQKLRAEPWRVLEADSDGRFLLHDAARCGASATVVYLIAEMYPEALRQKDAECRVPLQHALLHKPPKVGSIEVLLRRRSPFR